MKNTSFYTVLLKFTIICSFGYSLIYTAPAFSAPDDYRFRYLVQWGNMSLGESVANWRFSEDQVSMSGVSTPKGAIASFSDFEGRLSFKAHKNQDRWQPVHLRMHSSDGDETWIANTKWSDDGRIATTENSPDADLEEVYPLTDEMRQNVTAPFSAMLDMLEKLEAGAKCEGRFNIYDGWRSAELAFADFGTMTLEADRPWAFSGKVTVCGILTTPKGGHRRKSRFRSKTPSFENIKAYIGKHPSGKLVPVRIEVNIPVGKLTARLDMRP